MTYLSQFLQIADAMQSQAIRLLKRRALLACSILVCLSTMASANEPTIQQLFSFPCPAQQFGDCPLGYDPNTLIQASDGSFYGAAQLTTKGTSNPQGGTLFKITPSGQFTLLFTFAADNGNYLNGNDPASSLVEANDGFLYGTTALGGSTNNGVLFRIDKNGKNFQVLHNFCSEPNCADGGGAGVILGHDGLLYGTTAYGGNCTDGFNGCGTIFRFTPPSTLDTLLSLNGTTQGASPAGLVQGADGNVYGTAGSGVFRFTPEGEFTILSSFPR
jgi:uncharacterized repeat protein (TIGR03803 family)